MAQFYEWNVVGPRKKRWFGVWFAKRLVMGLGKDLALVTKPKSKQKPNKPHTKPIKQTQE